LNIRRNLPPMFANMLVLVALACLSLLHAFSARMDDAHIAGVPASVRVYALGIANQHGQHFGLDTNQIETLARSSDGTLRVGGGQSDMLDVQIGATTVRRVTAMYVAGDYFRALHVHPLAGRWITRADTSSDAAFAVIGERVARQLFGHAASAVGQALTVSDAGGGAHIQVRVTGVAPRGFHGVGHTAAELWLPYALDAPLMGEALPPGIKVVFALGNVPSFITAPADLPASALHTLLARLDTAAHAQPSVMPGVLAKPFTANTWLVVASPYAHHPLQQARLQSRLRLYLLVAALAAAFTIINAWAVAWLLALRRRPNLATARVLGMTHRLLLLDNARKAVLGWIAATLGTIVLLAVVLALSHGRLVAFGIQPARLPALALEVLVLVVPMLLGVMLVQRLPEVVYGWREPASNSASRAARGMRGVGGTTFFAASFFVGVLSVLAAWAVVLYVGMMRANLGVFDQPSTVVHIDRKRGYGAMSAFSASAAASSNSNRLLVQIIERATRVFAPDDNVGFGPVPGAMHNRGIRGDVSWHGVKVQVCDQYVSAGWLAAAQAHVLAGRGFVAGRSEGSAALVDADIARRLYGSPLSAVGHTLDSTGLSNLQHTRRIIGVLRTVRLTGASRSSCPGVFMDINTHAPGMVESGGGNLIITPAVPHVRWHTLADTVNSALARATPMLQVGQIHDSGMLIAALYGAQRRLASILFAVAAFTWLAALSGLVVMLRLQHDLQRRLLAIRSALGAGPRHLYAEVLLGTLALAMAGMLLVLLAAPLLAQQFALLSGAPVAPYGAATWLALLVLLLAVFLVAHFPARRVAHTEPAESLHEL